jgi:hypothetical protein
MECPADVPFTVIGVSFRRGMAASSAESVSFSFIHSNDVPGFTRPTLVIPGRASSARTRNPEVLITSGFRVRPLSGGRPGMTECARGRPGMTAGCFRSLFRFPLRLKML